MISFRKILLMLVLILFSALIISCSQEDEKDYELAFEINNNEVTITGFKRNKDSTLRGICRWCSCS